MNKLLVKRQGELQHSNMPLAARTKSLAASRSEPEPCQANAISAGFCVTVAD
jgi:hypothetical protein